MNVLDSSKPPNGDIFIRHGTKGEYSWPCPRCKALFVPTFYNPNNLIGFGKWTRCCGTCSMLNLMDFINEPDND